MRYALILINFLILSSEGEGGIKGIKEDIEEQL